GIELREQAVLVRAAHHTDVLEVELSVRGIPFVKYGGLRFTAAAHVKDFLAAARVVANPADDLAWFRLLRLHEGIGPVHARRIIDAIAPADPAPPGPRTWGPRRGWTGISWCSPPCTPPRGWNGGSCTCLT